MTEISGSRNPEIIGNSSANDSSLKLSHLRHAKKFWGPALIALAATAGALLPLVAQGLRGIPWPFEDAAMLFRYAETLARTGDLAFNPGEDPSQSDGATDLGFVIVIAVLIKAGFASITAAFLVNLVGLVLIGLAFGVANLRLWKLPTALVALVAFGITLSVSAPLAGGFSSAIFGAILLLLFLLSLKMFRNIREAHTGNRLNFYILGALAGLCGFWRPEGFALSLVVMLLAFVAGLNFCFARINRRCVWLAARRTTVGYLATLASWVALRLIYFGQLLPTSAVNKVSPGSRLSLDTLGDPLYYYVITLSWLWLGTLLVSFWLARWSLALIPMVSVLIASIIWLPTELTFNWWGRIFWPLLPVLGALSLSLVSSALANKSHGSRRNDRFIGLVLIPIAVWMFYTVPDAFGRYSVADQASMYQLLRPIDSTGVRVASSEAGLVPLAVNEGYALDTFVHNTRSIALEGSSALRGELEKFKPNLIYVNAYRSIGLSAGDCFRPERTPFEVEWAEMTDLIYEYAKENEFQVIYSLPRDDKGCVGIYALASPQLPTKVLQEISNSTNGINPP